MADKRQQDEDKNNQLVVDSGLLDSLLGSPPPPPGAPKTVAPTIRFVKPPPVARDPEPAPEPPIRTSAPVSKASSPVSQPATQPPVSSNPAQTEDKESPEALLHRAGEQSFLEGYFEDAAISFERVADHDPESWSAHYNLALCRERLEQWPEAVESFRAACKLEPRHWRAQTGLGFCLLRDGRAEEALHAFTEALETAPREYQPRLGRAMSQQALENYAEAHGLYAELIEEFDDSEDLLANLMLISLAMDRIGDATSYAERLRQISGGSHAALKAAAESFPSILV